MTTQTTISPNGHKRAVLYARVSSEEQAGENSVSITEQSTEMQARCNLNEWQMIGDFVDDKDYKATQSPKKGKTVNPSGERADRPQFLAMLEVIKSGAADVVMCWRDDRLVRHPRVASALEDALDLGDKARGNKTKIQIFDATGAEIDRFVLHIKAVIGREENKRRAERIRIGKVGTLKANRWPGGYQRLGYQSKHEADKRGCVIVLADSSELQTVKDIFNWYDAGTKVHEIRNKLIEQSAEQKGQRRLHEWNTSLIIDILRCKDYLGQATWSFGDGCEYTIDIPRIIEPEQWQRVQSKLDENKVLSTRNAHGVYLLQGILYCGDCKRMMRVNGVNYHQKRLADGTIKKYKLDSIYWFYQCRNASQHAKHEPHPHPFCWIGEKLDWDVWRYVVDNGIKHPELIRERILTRQAELQAQGENVDGDIAHTRQKLADIEQERANYQRQNARGKITDEEFDARMQETDGARHHWQDELVRLVELRDSKDKVSAGLNYVTDLMTGLQERLPEIDQDPDILKAMPNEKRLEILGQRQEIIRALCDRVWIWASGHIEIEGLLDGSEAAQFDLASLLTDLLKVRLFFEFDVIGGLFAKVPLPHKSPAEVLQ